jgi:predicted N-acyltransferase
MGLDEGFVVRVVERIADVAGEAWDACANWEAETFDPFVSHAFLKSLEDAGTVGGRTGWLARHLVLERAPAAEGEAPSVAGVMPLYLKSHSQGEYVFDQGWADALQRAGGRYYPKLLAAVPFTPVPGRRLLARAGADAMRAETMLAEGAIELARRAGLSSLHINFVDEACVARHTPLFLHRTDQQFHWRNEGYATFEDFLANLASRKRKVVRKERAEAVASGLTIEVLNGADIRETHWDAMFAFYMETGSRKWGRPYLNRAFFSLLGERMSRHCLLVMARRGGQYVAGALNLIGGDCLYGRYWGAIEHHPCLHFELCYYQAIEWAISHQLPRVEAGAQGEHKLARGYLPTTTHSLHWIADAGFRSAVARYLEAERRDVADISEQLASLAPYRKGARPQEHD